MRKLIAGPGVALLLLTGCGDDAPKAAETVTETATVVATETVTVPAEGTTIVDDLPYPKGFPKKVRVSSIPSPVKDEYAGFDFAVQLAPGVWTALSPGATVADAAATGSHDGFCASIKAFERKYRGGEEGSGSCW